MKSRITQVLIILALAVTGFATTQSFRSMSHHAFGPSVYPWEDEGYVLDAVMSAYKGGYLGYRCLHPTLGTCYGSVQSYADAATLKLLPNGWVTSPKVIEPEGLRWTWIAEYPNALKALRITRVLYAVGLLGLIWLLSLRLGFVNAALLTAAVGASASFASTYQGLKNGFPSAVWEIIFCACAYICFRSKNDRTQFVWALATVSTGMLGLLVRPVLLPPLLLFFAFYFVFRGFKSKRWTQAATETGVTAAWSLAFYTVLNPNTLQSSLEAKWLKNFWNMAAQPFQLDLFYKEVVLACLLLWPVGFWIWALVKHARIYGWHQTLQRWGFLFATAGALTLLTVKGLCVLSHYYLPILVIIVFGLIFTLYELQKVGKIFWNLFAAAAIVATGLAHFAPTPPSQKPVATLNESSINSLIRTLNTDPDSSSYEWLIDVRLHAPLLSTSAIPLSQIHYFDSLSESPYRVLDRLRASSKPLKILTTCWDPNSDHLLPKHYDIDSPAATDWAALTARRCQRYHPVNRYTTYAYDHDSEHYAEGHAILNAEDLMRFADKPSRFEILVDSKPKTMHILEGSAHAVSRYNGEKFDVFFASPRPVQAEFVFPQGLRRIQIPVWSSCLEPASVSLKVTTNHMTYQTTNAVLDIKPKFCGRYPKLCNITYFQNWSAHIYEAPNLDLSVDVKPGDRAKIEVIPSRMPMPESCSLLFGDLIVESASGGTSARLE